MLLKYAISLGFNGILHDINHFNGRISWHFWIILMTNVVFFAHYIINNTSLTNWYSYNFMKDINYINNDIINDIIEQFCHKPDGLLVKNEDGLLVENLVRHVSGSFWIDLRLQFLIDKVKIF